MVRATKPSEKEKNVRKLWNCGGRERTDVRKAGIEGYKAEMMTHRGGRAFLA